MDAFNDPDVETVVVKASSQVGKTEVLLNVTGYHTDQDPCPIILIEPTLDIAEAYSKDRLAPMIRDTPALADRIREPKAKDGGNTLLHKKFPGGHITLAGANSPSGLASRPIRIILCDEVDRYEASAGTEGDPVKLVDKRAATFWNRKKGYVSSPGVYPSRIDREFQNSDQRYFQVPCHACGQLQKLEWNQIRWEENKPETAHYVCIHCSATWNDAQRIEAVMTAEEKGGGWIPEAPFNGIRGFALWEAYSPWASMQKMVRAWLDAVHAKKQGNPEPLKTFICTTLGQVYVEDAEAVDHQPLLKRRENYTVEAIPWQVLYLTAAVDTQDDRLELEIVGWRATNRTVPPESWGLKYKILYGNPAQNDVWDELDKILFADYRTEDGRTMRIGAVCVDSAGHHTEAVYRYCNKHTARRVHAIVGRDGPRPIWPPRAGKSKKFKGSRVWTIGVDTAKDAIYARLKVFEPGPGFCHFPLPSEASGPYDETYFAQLTAEKIKTKWIKGKLIRYWDKPQGERNEALDLRVYNLAALHSRPVPWEILARSAPTEPPPEVKKAEVSDQTSEKTPDKAPDKPPPPKPPTSARRVRFKFGR